LNRSRVAFRIGICVVTVGLAIFLATLTLSLAGSTTTSNIIIPADGAETLVISFSNRPYEIRIVVPDKFKGAAYVFSYEGVRNLGKGLKTPLIEEAIEGPILFDFTPNRRGAYMILIESKISEQVGGSLNLVEKEAVSQDILGDSLLIVSSGFVIVAVTLVIKRQ